MLCRTENQLPLSQVRGGSSEIPTAGGAESHFLHRLQGRPPLNFALAADVGSTDATTLLEQSAKGPQWAVLTSAMRSAA